MANTFAGLQNLSEEELIDLHDKAAPSHSPGVDYYLRDTHQCLSLSFKVGQKEKIGAVQLIRYCPN